MKIIDLLNKIANGEEVPKKIKWEDTMFAYSEYDKDYLVFPFSEDEYDGLFCMKDSILTQFLDDEVEILEEEKKIPEKIKIDKEDRIQALSTGNFVYKVNQPTKNIIYKINEIIDYLESKGE